MNIYPSYLLILGIFFKDYDIELPDDKLENISIDPEENNKMGIYSIVTMGDDLQNSTCNLLAPIVINLEDKKKVNNLF